MKKLVVFALLLALTCGLTGCDKEKTQAVPDPPPSQTVTQAPAPTSTPTPTPTPTPEPTPPPTAEDIFPRKFGFGSGSGGWGTELRVAADGSFSGYYQDMDMGGDPPSTYFCKFSGQFSAPEKVDEYTYSVKLERLTKDDAKERLDESGMLWVPSIPYGLEDAEECLIYLPGAPVENLPEYFFAWAAHGYNTWDNDHEILPGYGLFNVKEEYGWFEMEDIFPREFTFMNGMGDWRVNLQVAADGSFTGHAEARDWLPMDAWELGAKSFTDFKGKFTFPEWVNDYTYSMKLAEFQIEPGREEVIDGVRYIPCDEYVTGFEDGAEYLVYLPYAPLRELPEEFLLWVKAPGGLEDDDTTLPWYGLYNAKEQMGWFEGAF